MTKPSPAKQPPSLSPTPPSSSPLPPWPCPASFSPLPSPTGREERYDGFEVGGALASETAGLTSGHGTHHDSTHTGGLGSTGLGSDTSRTAGMGSTGLGSDTSRTGGMGSSVGGTSSTSTSNTTGTHHKASLLDKLDPRKDSDGDGKKGFMK
ncbi:hypothetical protein LTR28_005327 [Elasticomyces elasticus]|nr:hypothetical protein LTR28_005327 [Elasticomyces elasticus]